MSHLLDVNTLVAWGWSDHVHHDRVVQWLMTLKKSRRSLIHTSPIPQLGFVRVSVLRARGALTPKTASEVLAGMIKSLGARHRFLPDDRTALTWPDWCRAASQTTDAHLLSLANAHGLKLATLDEGIRGAFVVPE